MVWCFYWTKIQNLKAILNPLIWKIGLTKGAFTEQRYKIWKQFSTVRRISNLSERVLLLNKDTKFESNSQLKPIKKQRVPWCFYWTKIQNLKAILNDNRSNLQSLSGAFTEQRYKIWKQFSTRHCRCYNWSKVLLLNKDTKFESNSQPLV